ncbi:MAG: preprotein translocase subunit SecG [Clostridia bacterium]|nr:preprotein translocase subunit SecG [Clostridia bacterium]
MQTTLIIIHVIISIILVVTVLMQHGKQQGLSGAIAGGAETFFGKNKGRTIDAVLKKVTAVVALLFIISSIVLATYSIQKDKAETEALQTEVQQQVEEHQHTEGETETEAETPAE